MPIPRLKKGTIAKTVPLTILFGSLAAYAAVQWSQGGQELGSVQWTEADSAATRFEPVALNSGTAGFDPEATQCSYPTTDVDIRTLTLVNTGGDDSAANAAAIADAITLAKAALIANPNRTIVLKIPAGTWEIGGTAIDAINLDGVNNGVSGTGWLVISGDTMQNTTLNFTNYQQQAFKGNNVYRVNICNLHVTRSIQTTTQGTVLGVLSGAVWSDDVAPFGSETLTTVGTLDTSGTASSQTIVVDLHAGFPTPDAIYDTGLFKCQGRYLRKYKYAGVNPVIELDNNPIEPWIMKYQITGTGTSLDGKWAIRLGRPRPGTNDAIYLNAQNVYFPGDQLAIKAKKTRDAMFFGIGSDIVVENVRLTRATRIVFRGGTVSGATMDNVRISNVAVERGPAIGGKIPFIASAEGGPQFFGLLLPTPAPSPTPTPTPAPYCPAASGGEPAISTPMHNAVVENSDLVATGDDALGMFNVDGFTMTGTNIGDGLGRGIAFANGATTPCIRALINRAPIYTDQSPGFTWGCVTDSTAPSPVSGVAADTTTAGRIRLTWSSTNPADWDGFEITRYISGSPDKVYPVVIGLRANAYNDISIRSGVTYVYTVKSFDKSRNYSTATTVTATAP